ncbi:MAG: arginine--tRNA ligase [Candidatus Tectimicrobiota bacterium]|nr:MAG: arginine--tRNA ligase [Candidatus Tectomicrobia bacterium]
MEKYREAVAQWLAPVLNMPEAEVLALLRLPPDSSLGDYALPCFALARTWRRPPQQIAAELATRLALRPPFAAVVAHGPYLNITLDDAVLSREVLETILAAAEHYGEGREGQGKKVLIDYSSPNIAKELAFHHIRSTMIGHALKQILRARGYTVEGINHLGDWGTPFGLLIAAYKRFGWDAAAEVEPIVQLNALYVRATEEAARDPAFAEEGRRWFQRLEAGDAEARRCWQWFVEVSLAEFQKVYDLLGVSFEHILGESFYEPYIAETLEWLQAKGLVKESDGACIVDLSAYDMPPFMLKKQDGTTLYSTRDLAALLYRKRVMGFDCCLYVVDMGQSLHFRQLFKVLELAGCDWVRDCHHVPFGLVLMKDPDSGRWVKGSTRKGRVSLLKAVLEEAIAMAREKIAASNPTLANPDAVARQVGVGAVVFNDLKNRRIKDVKFDKEAILNPYGETGPYMQYTHARCASVLAAAPVTPGEGVDYALLREPEERALVRKLAAYPEAVASAAREWEPAIVAQHLLAIAADFNSYWTRGTKDARVRILREQDPATTAARVTLTAAVRTVLRNGLRLLGVPAPDEM